MSVQPVASPPTPNTPLFETITGPMAADCRDEAAEIVSFDEIRETAAQWVTAEPLLAGWLQATILRAKSFAEVLSIHLADKIADSFLQKDAVKSLVREALEAEPCIERFALRDLVAHHNRNPACPDHLTPLLFFKGYLALQNHRIAHYFWGQQRLTLSHYLQSRGSETFGVDIHPRAPIGPGVFIDHASSVVIGETAVVEKNVSILQGVTLGGTGKESGDRHPKVREGVLISAGAKVLGNIEIGANAKIAAGSVVLKPVPANATVAGVPAKIVRQPRTATPAIEMDQSVTWDEPNLDDIIPEA